MPDTSTKTSSSTSRRVWQLAWPTILSNLLFTTVGFMHIKIVASLGTSSVAAVTTGHRVFFLIQAILMGVSVAATALIARSWGAKQVEQAEMVAWTSLIMSLVLAAALSIPVIFIPEAIAGLFGLDQETTHAAATFIFWLGLFNIFSAASMMLSTALRAAGDVITPLWFLFFSSILNILFAYFLAYGIGPFPAMGVAGVAFGGGSAGLVISCLFVASWWRGKFRIKPVKRATVDWAAARQLFVIGGPAILEQGIIQIAFLAFFSIMAQYGTSAYAAYGIGITLVSFSLVIGFGFGIATATLVGQQLGAGHPDLAMAAGWRSLRMALVAMITLSALLAWNARTLAQFMIPDPEVIDLTVAFIYIIALSQPMMACEFTLAGALRGAGDTRFPLIATFCGIILGRLIPAWVVSRLGFSVYWIFGVMMLDYTIKATLLLYRYKSRKWLDVSLSGHRRPSD
ncbi:MAG: MATE family efflux transporter [Halieaceae bacterium]|nr:MATE family efflux transporter [Halieaceae bacterium]